MLGMPTRDTVFMNESDLAAADIGLSTTIGQYINETDSWKSWGNKEQGKTGENKVGRRFTTYDQACTMRNMLISIVATKGDSQLLLDLRAAQMNALQLKLNMGSFVLSLLGTLTILSF